jgi:voltage-gated potassium channel
MLNRVRGVRADGGYDRYVAATDRTMVGLSLAFVLVLLLPLLHVLPAAAADALRVVNFALWAVFAVDYAIRLALAPARWEFVRRHPVDLLVVLVPFFRPLRALRLARAARVGVVATALSRRAERSFHLSVALWVAGSAGLLIVVAAVAMYDAERNAPGSNVKTLSDALWWAASTVTTVGYGDRFPVTGQGRLIGVALMVVGIALLGVVTASVAAWFVDRLRRVESAEQQTAATLDEVLDELRALRSVIERTGLDAPAVE